MVGKTISHYKIIEKLGEGGMGVVYKAEDTKLKRTVALKFLPRHVSWESTENTRFIQEAQAASALNHPNIITIYEIDEYEGQSFIAMEFLDGPTLRERIESGPLEIKDVLDIALQVGEGLKEAHDNSIVHRDIKSDNLMTTSKSRLVKITDFGLAKLKVGTRLTKTGTTVGTLAYSSPEQVSGGELDHRSDIFSFGVVLYELLTGKLPFQGDYEAAIVYSIMSEDPQPIRELREQISGELEGIVKKALEKERRNRYQNMGELLADLRQLKKFPEMGIDVESKFIFTIKRKSQQVLLPLIALAFIAIVFSIVKFWILGEKPVIAKIPIGVMYFDNQTGESKYDYLRKSLAEMLITDLGQSRFLQLLTFQRMFDLLRSMGQEDVELIDESIGFQVCNFANIEVMIRGSLIKTGDIFALNAQVLDVSTKRQLNAYNVKGEGEDCILGHLIDELSHHIKSTLAVSERIKKVKDQNIAELTTESLEAYKFYMAGIEASFNQHHQEAVDNFKRALSMDPTFKKVYRSLARQYFLLGEKSKALDTVEKLIKLRIIRDEEEMLEILLENAIIKNDKDSEINYLKQLIRLDPDKISAHFDLGMAYYQYKLMFEEGIAEFEKVLELDSQGLTPYSSYTYNVLGYAHIRKGQFLKAYESFRKYVAFTPNHPDPLDSFGEVSRIVGQYEQAITSFQKALNLRPDYTICYAHLGDTYVEKGMYEQAWDAYSKYLSASTSKYDQAEAHYKMARFELLRNNYLPALTECAKAKDINPDMMESYWICGLCLVKQNKLDLAKNEADSIEKWNEKTRTGKYKFHYHHLLGEIALGKKQYTAAIDQFIKAAAVGSLDRAVFLKSLAEANLRADNLNNAIETYNVIFGINPNDALAHYGIGLVYEKKGEVLKAKQHYQKFLNIWEEADDDLQELIDAKTRLTKLSRGS